MLGKIIAGTVATLLIAVLVSVCLSSRTASPVEIVEINYDSRLIAIKLHESLTTGTDSACYASALIINAFCENGWKVYVTNDWVPSNVNPISLEHSRILVENRGEPFRSKGGTNGKS